MKKVKSIRFKSLGSRLSAFFLLVSLAPLIAAIFIQASYLNAATTRGIEENEKAIAKAGSETIGLWINDKMSKLQSMTKNHPEFKDMNTDIIIKSLNEVHKSDADAEAYFVIDKDGGAVTDEGRSVFLGELSYFKTVKEKKTPVISDITKSTLSGINVVIFLQPILDDSGDFKGALALMAKSESIENTVAGIKIGETGYGFLLSQTGRFITNPDVIKRGMAIEAVLPSETVKIFKDNVIAKDTGVIRYTDDKKISKIGAYYEVPVAGWKFVVTAPVSEVYGEVSTSIYISVGLVAVAAILVILISMLLSKVIANPVKNVSTMMKRIADGDLSGRMQLKTRDEIGRLAHDINSTLEKFSSMIGDIKGKSLSLDDSAVNLSSTSQQMASSIQEIAESIQETASGASDQAKDISEVLSLLEDFNTKLERLYDSLSSIKDGASGMEKMSNDGKGRIDELTLSIKDIEDSFEMVLNNIVKLNDNIKRIDEITVMIKTITNQTSLLSLNAAIEAARAGEAGKGFSVVAEEVRKLAEQSKESTDEIAGIIKAILEDSDMVVSTSGSMKQKLYSQGKNVQSTTESFKGILNSVYDVSNKINEAYDFLNSMIKEKDDIVHRMESVSAVSEETTASAQEISASAEEMSASTEEISASAQTLGQLSKELVQSVEMFKI